MAHPLCDRFIKTNGITLHVVEAGPEQGPPVVLLHGFPEFWYGWRKQIDFLADAGYRLLIPDQRGYNLSDKPKGIAAYSLDELAADVLGLIDATGHEKAAVVGHDWGAAVAWWTALHHPHRLKRVAILNVPHPAVMQQHLRTDLRQLFRSWYMIYFQLPWLPEWGARRANWRSMVQALEQSSRPGTFTAQDFEQYRRAWSQPGAIKAMINWYRAGFRARLRPLGDPRVRVPVLMIWGARDRFIGRKLAAESIDLCQEGRLVFLEAATHWVQHEEAGRVNELLGEFLAGAR